MFADLARHLALQMLTLAQKMGRKYRLRLERGRTESAAFSGNTILLQFKVFMILWQ